MKAIQYHYTHTAKQIFFLVCFIYTILRFTVILEVALFKLPGFYEQLNIPLTLVLYLFLFLFLFLLFRQHKFCYSLYDDDTLTYYNLLLRKSRSLQFSDVGLAVFDTFGVKFYRSESADPKKDKPFFFLPFFRGGIIEAVQLNDFYKMLKDREGIQVFKTFKILPGYTKKWRFVAIFYGFLAIIFFMSSATPLTTALVLFKNH